MVKKVFQFTGFLFGLFALAGSAWSQSQYTIQLQREANGVNYLTDGKGMTLYYYTYDANGESACNGACVDKWPVFYTPEISVPSPLSEADFAAITRSDGAKETTYRGWPLYYWFQDKNPGDKKGEGVGKVWYVVEAPAYTVMVGTNKSVGNYLTDGNGNTLYYYTKDSPEQSACTGNCIANWPVFAASSIVVPSALKPSDFATITRPDGKPQVTYKGYPLYYFVRDQSRGALAGQGVGGVWYVIDPVKFPPAKAAMGGN
jgi:predicted lipoprotein with Yx(FWY)xxD motif